MATWPAVLPDDSEVEPLTLEIGTHAWVAGIDVVAGDSTAPVIDNFSPTVGTPIDRTDPLNFDITDTSGLKRAVIMVEHGSDVDVVHDGDKFCGEYGNLSSRAIIADGFRYSIRRNGGWLYAPKLKIAAYDTDGNETQ